MNLTNINVYIYMTIMSDIQSESLTQQYLSLDCTTYHTIPGFSWPHISIPLLYLHDSKSLNQEGLIVGYYF